MEKVSVIIRMVHRLLISVHPALPGKRGAKYKANSHLPVLLPKKEFCPRHNPFVSFASTMRPRVVLVTGANTGIGFQIVRALCSSSEAYSILVGGRSLAKVQDAIKSAETEFSSTQSNLFPIQVDLESDASINRAFDQVQTKFGKLDALVNNAGMWDNNLFEEEDFADIVFPGVQLDQQLAVGKLTEREMWNQTWDVNTTGTQVLTSTFIPLLLQSVDPRLLFLTSGTSTLTGSENVALPLNQSPVKGWPKLGFNIPAYRSAKTGLIMMMREWHRMLKEDGVKVWCISPGFLATGLGGNTEALKKMGAGDPEIAGPFIRSVLEGQRDADVGKVITKDGIQPW